MNPISVLFLSKTCGVPCRPMASHFCFIAESMSAWLSFSVTFTLAQYSLHLPLKPTLLQSHADSRRTAKRAAAVMTVFIFLLSIIRTPSRGLTTASGGAHDAASEAAREAAKEAAQEAYKETYDEAYKEAYDQAYKEVYDEAYNDAVTP